MKNKIPPPRKCLDCPTDLTFEHGNKRRCEKCSWAKMKAEQLRFANRRRAS